MTEHAPIHLPAGQRPSSTPLWYATAAAGPDLPALAADIVADVLVIGSGIAGLSTALHLAEAGVDVALVEAARPGSGATGQSGGLIAPDYIRHTPETIGPLLGRADAERLTRMIGGSGQRVFDLVERHGIDCDARPEGFYTPAHTEALADEQRRYAALWLSRGFPVRFVEASHARRVFGAHRYFGALHFAQGGSLNPLAFARGLAAAALRAGARIHGGTPAEPPVRAGDRWQVKTPGGSVTARRLVLAANGGNAALHSALRRTALPLHVVQFATAPLSTAERARILPEGGAFTDKVPYLFTARLDGQGHLISAFPRSFLVRGDRGYGREARRRLKQHFGGLTDPQIDYLWEGTAWVNPTLLPAVYDLGSDGLAIQADNGRGLAMNTAIGAEVAEMLAKRDPDALSLKLRVPAAVRGHAGASLLPKLLMSMAYLSN